MFCKNAFMRTFRSFAGNHLCQSSTKLKLKASNNFIKISKLLFSTKSMFSAICFLRRFPFTDTNDSHDNRGMKGILFIPAGTFRHSLAILCLK